MSKDYSDKIKELSELEKTKLLNLFLNSMYLASDGIYFSYHEDSPIAVPGDNDYELFKKITTPPIDLNKFKEDVLALSYCEDEENYNVKICLTMKVKNSTSLSDIEKELIKKEVLKQQSLTTTQLNELFEKKEVRINCGYGYFALSPIGLYDFNKEIK